jgi:hypothetical protein
VTIVCLWNFRFGPFGVSRHRRPYCPLVVPSYKAPPGTRFLVRGAYRAEAGQTDGTIVSAAKFCVGQIACFPSDSQALWRTAVFVFPLTVERHPLVSRLSNPPPFFQKVRPALDGLDGCTSHSSPRVRCMPPSVFVPMCLLCRYLGPPIFTGDDGSRGLSRRSRRDGPCGQKEAPLVA